jgi:hypothetical protein
VCGSVALADPSAELPLVLARSAATIVLSSQRDAAACKATISSPG